MSRVNDIGGQSGFGAVEPDIADVEPFHSDWEARVFALNAVLQRRGAYTINEYRDAMERMSPREYLAASYYERRLIMIETLMREKGVIVDE